MSSSCWASAQCAQKEGRRSDGRRIGIFEYDWSMYHFTKDLAIKLAEAGYSVDIFFKDWDVRPHYADTSEFGLYEGIRFVDFTTKETQRQIVRRRYIRLLNRIAILLGLARNDRPDQIIDAGILNKSKELIGTRQYSCLIGTEKKGLIWAGMLSELYHWPLIYHSLELYMEDNPALDRVYHLLAAERRFHKAAIATIIQDEARAKVLLDSNGIRRSNVLYFPVSAKGGVVQKRPKRLQTKLQIDDRKKIVLYFGRIEKTRFMSQLVEMATRLDEGTILVVHGVGPERYVKYLQSIADKNKVVFSLEFIPEDEIEELIGSADVGIALYETTNANDRLVAFSSSKVAYYTQCGVPMIAFDTESFRALAASFQCVELITGIEEIPLRVRMILKNYDWYRQQAYLAFKALYGLDDNFSKLLGGLEAVIESAT